MTERQPLAPTYRFWSLDSRELAFSLPPERRCSSFCMGEQVFWLRAPTWNMFKSRSLGSGFTCKGSLYGANAAKLNYLDFLATEIGFKLRSLDRDLGHAAQEPRLGREAYLKTSDHGVIFTQSSGFASHKRRRHVFLGPEMAVAFPLAERARDTWSGRVDCLQHLQPDRGS